jgi:rhodanese-related sulfurtransferase
MSGWGPPPPVVPEVELEQLDAARAEGGPVIDVRQPDEYESAHVPGARLIPLGEVAARLGEVPTDGTVYVICQSGSRSARATDFLRRQGIDARNVAGGTKAWVESGRTVARGPQPG